MTTTSRPLLEREVLDLGAGSAARAVTGKAISHGKCELAEFSARGHLQLGFVKPRCRRLQAAAQQLGTKQRRQQTRNDVQRPPAVSPHYTRRLFSRARPTAGVAEPKLKSRGARLRLARFFIRTDAVGLFRRRNAVTCGRIGQIPAHRFAGKLGVFFFVEPTRRIVPGLLLRPADLGFELPSRERPPRLCLCCSSPVWPRRSASPAPGPPRPSPAVASRGSAVRQVATARCS